jgi:hypothetical protein
MSLSSEMAEFQESAVIVSQDGWKEKVNGLVMYFKDIQ